MIETFDTFRNGEVIRLHRCADCSRGMARIMGRPVDDNGFIPADRPIRHLPKCEFHPNESGRRDHGR
jgi:hypothetical protein